MSAYPAAGIAAPVRRGTVAVFLGVTFAVTWGLWLPLLVDARTAPSGTLDAVPATFFIASVGPAVGAVAATWFAAGPAAVARWARRILRLRFGGFWWFAALGMPALYYLIGFFTAAFAAGGWPDPAAFGTTAKLPGLPWPLVALVWAATFGLGEEVGWRGWLLPALAERVTVFWASVLVAVVWIVWHAPAFFFNPTYQAMGAGIVGWMLALVLGSFVLSWMTAGARWSIVPVVLWHAGFDLLTAADQSAGMIASTISAVVMVQGAVCAVLLWRRRMPRHPRHSPHSAAA